MASLRRSVLTWPPRAAESVSREGSACGDDRAGQPRHGHLSALGITPTRSGRRFSLSDRTVRDGRGTCVRGIGTAPGAAVLGHVTWRPSLEKKRATELTLLPEIERRDGPDTSSEKIEERHSEVPER
ncbi:MAG: hypothetical protein JWM85_2202 [Acidimicrobiaceae bacterium]|nr:hypothetical protein [Acidimicrobiaceae bacterium]